MVHARTPLPCFSVGSHLQSTWNFSVTAAQTGAAVNLAHGVAVLLIKCRLRPVDQKPPTGNHHPPPPDNCQILANL